MNKILSWFTGGVVKEVGKVIDNLFTSDEERENVKAVYTKFIAPMFSLPVPPLEDEFWSLLNLGIGGYVVGRSAEKVMKEYKK